MSSSGANLIFVLMPIDYDVLVTQNDILPLLSLIVLRLAPFCTCPRSLRALPAPIARLPAGQRALAVALPFCRQQAHRGAAV
jgi:hypothetical protein